MTRLSEQLALLSSTTTELLGSSLVEADNLQGVNHFFVSLN